MNTAKEDILLWESFRKGDREAFATLFRNNYELLFRYGGKFTNNSSQLEDSIQELFVELWQSKSRNAVVSVRAYLLKSLKYKLLKTYRQSRITLSAGDNDGTFEFSHEHFLVAGEEEAERKRLVLRALEQLSDRQKEIIYLKFYQDLSYEEVSEIMSINYQAARNLLYQAIKSLKNRLPRSLQLFFLLSAIIGHYILDAANTL